MLKNDTLPNYVVLGNGKSTWSVQTDNTIFYKKQSIQEIKNEYDKIIMQKDNEIKKLKLIIQQYKMKI